MHLKLNRRAFLTHTITTIAGLAFLSPCQALASLPRSRTISFYHTHTGERFNLTRRKGGYTVADRKNLATFLRDFRTGDIHPMDARLFAILARIQEISGSKGVYEVISGYRSPKTNEMLRSSGSGVAKKSYHMTGQAIDIRLTDVKTRKLRDIAIRLNAGGVGYYRDSDFVHIDTGPVRRW